MNSKILLVKNIHIDRQYTNVLSYSESQMLELCRSQNHLIAEANNYSFLRPTGSIMAGFSYSQCLQANYIAFQNPDYSNKWFFAWIDDVIYKGDKNTELTFTIDAWSTWFDKWQKKTCFIKRHHVNDDTIGLNLVEEPLNFGDFVVNKKAQFLRNEPSILYTGSDLCIVLSATEKYDGTLKDGVVTDGIYAGCRYYVFHNTSAGITDLNNWLNNYNTNQKRDAITSLYLIPEIFTSGADREDHLYAGSNTVRHKYINHGSNNSDSKEITFSTSNIDGYVPKNNKLFTKQFCYLLVSNNNGMAITYNFEDFYTDSNNTRTLIEPKFTIYACMTPSGAIRLVPENYKGALYNDDEGLNLGKFPMCSWNTDEYINWLTQNGVNTALNLAGNTIAIGGNISAGNIGGVVSNSISIANTINEIYKASKIPNQVHGNTNNGDVITASGKNDFIFYTMTIKKQSAKIVDDYFTRYGYAINSLELPNITGREYWNYVEIGDSEEIGYGEVPSKFMDTINNACRRGVTIWHNHANVGNYSLNNEII